MASIDKEDECWIHTMKHIRQIPGTIYYEDLVELISFYGGSTIESDPLTYLNNYLELDGTKKKLFWSSVLKPNCHYTNFLKRNPITNEIYTVPSQRQILDPLIKCICDTYIYNENLYSDYPLLNNKKIHNLKKINSLKGKYTLDSQSATLDLKLGDPSQKIHYSNFDLQNICKEISSYERTNIQHIHSIDATNAVFHNEVTLSFSSSCRNNIDIQGCLIFNGATFFNKVTIRRLHIISENKAPAEDINSIIDFRNSRFFDDIELKAIDIVGNSLIRKISFEDARIEGKLIIDTCRLENISLYCFQAVFGDYISEFDCREENHQCILKPIHNEASDLICSKCLTKKERIILRNVQISAESEFHLVDIEMLTGIIVLQDIATLPIVRISPLPIKRKKNIFCPDVCLKVNNCEIHSPFFVKNVSTLTFFNTTNYSKIIEQNDWAEMPNKKSLKKKTYGLLGTVIPSNILIAIYNDNTDKDKKIDGINKAQEFIMIKENFASNGQYDYEDVAFILYMEYKPYIDAKMSDSGTAYSKITKFIYQFLYAVGKYGISPLRILVAMGATIISFALFVYFPMTIKLGTDAFVLSELEGEFWSLNSAEEFSYMDMLLASFLFSLQAMIPFVSQFISIHWITCLFAAIEGFIGTFLAGYFSVAVVRKTLR